jgi:ABC-type transporter Mla MlaB component
LSDADTAEAFQLPPEITFANVIPLRDDGERFIRDELDSPAFSLAGLKVSNSTAVALLLGWFRRAHRMGKVIVFTDIPEDLLNIIEVSGLSEVLPLQTESVGTDP